MKNEYLTPMKYNGYYTPANKLASDEEKLSSISNNLTFKEYQMKKLILIGLIITSASGIFASDNSAVLSVNSGDTAWVLIATALVMFMTVPALALFYGGLVKRKNILSVLMQCFITLALVSLIWVAYGYSLAFSTGEIIPGIIGNFKWAFLNGVGQLPDPNYGPTIPHLAFMIFQGMFAVITPALIIGAFAERMKFSAYLVFTVLWTTLVYCPVAHWVWSSGGWLNKLGAIDFAGGIVVHIIAGISALVTAVIIGKRKNLRPSPPHNLVLTMTGASMLWFGWFGFNAGSSLAANGIAVNAFVATNTAAAAATIVWLVMDWILVKKPTMLGSATGAIAGLAAVTPASGFIDIRGAMFTGAVSSIICYYMVVIVKSKLGYDDALDAFGVHGVGGIWGSLAVGIVANPAVQSGYKGILFGGTGLIKAQAIAVAVTALYSLAVTYIIYKLLDFVMGIRVEEDQESVGLDIIEHNERAYTVID